MKVKGFTLIEVMITVAIVGILAAIAYPSYTEYVKKAARVEAMTTLLDIANKQEQFFSDNHQYTTDLANLGASSTTEGGLYTITVAASGGTTFTLTATPLKAPATTDTECTAFTVTDTGAKGSSGSATTATCWGK